MKITTRILWIMLLIGPLAATAQANPRASRDDAAGACEQGYLKRGIRCIAISAATDKEIRALLIAESIAGYSGSCPCPYNADRAGRSCGRRSAYSRPGGRSPRCYEGDIPDAEVKALRERYRAQNDRQPSDAP